MQTDFTMNRLANSKNPYQGRWKRVLTLCSAGLLRSPSIAHVLSNPPYNCNVRAAGVSPEYALVPIDIVLVNWADEIVCAEEWHGKIANKFVAQLNEKFNSTIDKPVHILHIPDSFQTREQELLSIIQEQLKKIDFKGTE